MKKEIDISIICPVRKVSSKVEKFLKKYVAELKEDNRVHYPPDDTDQTDPIGNKICESNFRAFISSKEIRRWYNDESTGGHFDFGGVFMLYVLRKLMKEIGEQEVLELIKEPQKIVFINKGEVPYNPGKSFQKVLSFLHKETVGTEE